MPMTSLFAPPQPAAARSAPPFADRNTGVVVLLAIFVMTNFFRSAFVGVASLLFPQPAASIAAKTRSIETFFISAFLHRSRCPFTMHFQSPSTQPSASTGCDQVHSMPPLVERDHRHQE